MGKITIGELSNGLRDYIQELGLTEEQVINIINKKLSENNTDELLTNDKTIVGAINELFQNANNGKQIIADAVGSPLSAEDTFAAMAEKIYNIKGEIELTLQSQGLGGTNEDSLQDSISKIKDMKLGTNLPSWQSGWASGSGLGISGGCYHLSAATAKGNPYAIGGYRASNKYFDIKLGTWTGISGRSEWALSCTSLKDKIYTFGGSSNLSVAAEYDPDTNAWTAKTNMTNGRHNATSAGVGDYVYVIGGNGAAALNSCLDPVNNTWTTKANMPTSREGLACAVIDKKIYVVGGSTSPNNQNEVYDTEKDEWEIKTPMITGRTLLGAGAINGKVYAVGGSAGNKLECYDPYTDEWSTMPNMPSSRDHLGATVAGDSLYVFGGHLGGNYSNANECFTPIREGISVSTIEKSLVEPIAQSIGDPVSAEDSVVSMCEKVDNITDNLRVKLNNKGIDVEEDEKINSLVNKVSMLRRPDDGIPSDALVQDFVNTIGDPCTTDDSLTTINGKLITLIDALRTNLSDNGHLLTGEESFLELVDRIKLFPRYYEKYYLYNEGIINTDWVGNFTVGYTYDLPTQFYLTMNSNNMAVSSRGNTSYPATGVVYTTKMIDLTPYVRLMALVDVTSVEKSTCILGISTNRSYDVNPRASTTAVKNGQVLSLDISSQTGSYYIGFGIGYAGKNNWLGANFYKIWLE